LYFFIPSYIFEIISICQGFFFNLWFYLFLTLLPAYGEINVTPVECPPWRLLPM
jgi:hypothetical protein